MMKSTIMWMKPNLINNLENKTYHCFVITFIIIIIIIVLIVIINNTRKPLKMPLLGINSDINNTHEVFDSKQMATISLMKSTYKGKLYLNLI